MAENTGILYPLLSALKAWMDSYMQWLHCIGSQPCLFQSFILFALSYPISILLGPISILLEFPPFFIGQLVYQPHFVYKCIDITYNWSFDCYDILTFCLLVFLGTLIRN